MARWLKRAVTKVIKPTCPDCNAPIAPDDINVAEGVMLCRACGKMSFIRAESDDKDPIVETLASWSPQGEPVVRPPRPTTRVEQLGSELVLHRRTGSIPGAVFMILWLIGWTVGCVFLVREVIRERSLFMVLFATPFLAAWFAVFSVIVGACFGRERLRLSPAGLAYRWEALIPLKTIDVPLEDVREIQRFATAYDSDSSRRQHGLKIRTADKDIRFGKGVSDEELLWLADTIRRHLHTLDPRLLVSPRPAAENGRPREVATKVRDEVEVLKPDSSEHDRPADSDMALSREFNRTEFVRCGTWRGMLGTFAVVTFINLFWNGIVAVFVYQLVTDFEWFLFFFLIPFEGIGLVMLGIWLALVAAPLWRRGWVFTPGEITSSFTVLGIGPTRHHRLERIDRMELRPNTARRKRWQSTDQDEEADSACSLVLVAAGQDLIEMDSLTEKEARWMADVLFADFRQWFILR